LQDFAYSERLTANLTLDRMPETCGEDPAWDNAGINFPNRVERTV